MCCKIILSETTPSACRQFLSLQIIIKLKFFTPIIYSIFNDCFYFATLQTQYENDSLYDSYSDEFTNR